MDDDIILAGIRITKRESKQAQQGQIRMKKMRETDENNNQRTMGLATRSDVRSCISMLIDRKNPEGPKVEGFVPKH